MADALTLPRARGRMHSRRRLLDRVRGPLAFYAGAFLLTAFFLGPVLWTVISSLKQPHEITTYPPVIVPEQLRYQNYLRAWTKVPFLAFYLNSLTVTLLAVLGQCLSATLVAYGFARFEFPLRGPLFMLVIATLIVPWEVTIVPSFLLYKWLDWLDTLKPLIVPYWFGGSPFFIFLLRQFFMTIPRDFDEAAEIDGANPLQVLIHVIAPLCVPAITTVAIFSFLQHWNEFIQPLIFLNSPENFTVSLGLRFFQTSPADPGEPKEHLLMAAAVIASLPCVALFFAAQRFFVRGIVLSGIKG
ncbi:MAG: carbohydrate ABC transporter permease [Chloroflexota bacterium]